MSAPRRWLLLPARGVRPPIPDLPEGLRFTFAPAAEPASRPAGVRVLDEVRPGGVALAEMDAARATAFARARPDLRVVPEVFYRPALAPRARPTRTPRGTVRGGAARLELRLRVAGTRRAFGPAEVAAFTDYATGEGVLVKVRADGALRLPWRAESKRLDALVVYPLGTGSWGWYGRDVLVTRGDALAVEPLDLAVPDALVERHGRAPLGAGRGVAVGIVDTGVGPHPDLVLAGGRNTVVGERRDDFADSGAGHGTHVAGIVAGRGRLGRGMRGLAPGVRLFSYRVFGRQRRDEEGPDASNYAILKALDRAVEDGCDLVNLSLGGGDPDPALSDAVADARDRGTLVIGAAGNEARRTVSYPARLAAALAVSAVGREGTFPATALAAEDVSPVRGRDRRDFLAVFSNVGREIDLCAPGVGVVSTMFDGYAPLSGTSMACPAAVGAAARLLAASPTLLAAPRDRARTDAFARLLLARARSLGFRPEQQGQGALP
jgi:subtilisin